MLICPNCGKGTSSLREDTGWCNECSEKVGKYICKRCSNPFSSISKRPFCSSCRVELWLEQNADKIEFYIEHEGLTTQQAIEKVRNNNHSEWRCVSCTDKLNRQGLFCGKTECRNAYRRFYRRLKQGENLTVALHNALKDG